MQRLLLLLLITTAANAVSIKTNQGIILGANRVSRAGDKFTAFLGIPYAEPPIGDLRWAPPKPLEKGWEGVRDGTKDGDECLQNSFRDPSENVGSEDCLFVNVYTRHPGDANAKRPVLVWIHGGAFIDGGGPAYDPYFLMEEDVVVVVIQYRLNIFGFLSNEDKELPGNYGMKDQQEALRWVHKNIETYGGDPKHVSLFGMSAGGASIHYHMLSPNSKGLFNSAISFSGSSLNWWAGIEEPAKKAQKLAEIMGCDKTSGHMIDCLRQKPASDIANAHNAFFDWEPNNAAREPMNQFSPHPDPEAEDPFLPEHPLVAMQNGHINDVPYMLGYAEKEGNWRVNSLTPDGPKGLQLWTDFVHGIDKLLPLISGIFDNNSNDKDEVMKKLKKYYNIENMSNPPLDRDVNNLVDLSGDSMFNYGIDVTAKLHAKHSKGPTYFEYITYPLRSSLTLFRTDGSKGSPPYDVLKTATHGTDMFMMWNKYFGPLSKEDETVSRKFNKMVVDFLINGRPTLYPDWKPLREDNYSHLLIDKDFTVLEGLPFQDRMEFWQGLNVFWNSTLASPKRDEL